MGAILNEDWTADVKGQMHKYRISNPQLAAECGYTAAYLSMVLNGHKTFESDGGKQKTIDNIFNALERIKSRIMENSDDAES